GRMELRGPGHGPVHATPSKSGSAEGAGPCSCCLPRRRRPLLAKLPGVGGENEIALNGVQGQRPWRGLGLLLRTDGESCEPAACLFGIWSLSPTLLSACRRR